ncbi:FmdB family zinc ribbon protein [Vulgatibacter sp.]|uniref:FmdB family zinc ribbon protein n=1 Tax=Vulgatibacter sp. TaxID=1971226 RepID=UPI00356285A6
MPIYEYECKSCGVYEVNHRITEPARTACETCGGEVRRLISNTAFMLKGGGWYADGYGSKNGASAAASEKSSDAGGCGAGACGTGGGCGAAEA